MSWIGSQANIFEKQKVREIASLIRDTDRHGKARIVDTNEGEEPEEMLNVNSLLFFCNCVTVRCVSLQVRLFYSEDIKTKRKIRYRYRYGFLLNAG